MSLLQQLLNLLLFRPPERPQEAPPAAPAPSAPPEVVEASPMPSPAAPEAPTVPVAPDTGPGPESDPKTRTTKLTPALIGCVIAACTFIGPATQQFEGKRNHAYYDSGKVPTICFGHTGPDVRMGMYWTDGQCHLVFTKDQERLGMVAARCTPATVIRNKYMMGSVIDFAFNGGPGLYCKSSMRDYFWQGEYAKGCNAYSRYVYTTDRRTHQKFVVKGLVPRRTSETATCMKGVSK